MNTKNYSLLCIDLITFNFFFSKIRVVEININLKVLFYFLLFLGELKF